RFCVLLPAVYFAAASGSAYATRQEEPSKPMQKLRYARALAREAVWSAGENGHHHEFGPSFRTRAEECLGTAHALLRQHERTGDPAEADERAAIERELHELRAALNEGHVLELDGKEAPKNLHPEVIALATEVARNAKTTLRVQASLLSKAGL